MDIQEIIEQVEKAVQSDPSLVQKLMSNPSEAISGLTGQSIDADALNNVISALSKNDNGIDLGNIAETVEKALGDNIADAAGDLLGNLFGGNK